MRFLLVTRATAIWTRIVENSRKSHDAFGSDQAAARPCFAACANDAVSFWRRANTPRADRRDPVRRARGGSASPGAGGQGRRHPNMFVADGQDSNSCASLMRGAIEKAGNDSSAACRERCAHGGSCHCLLCVGFFLPAIFVVYAAYFVVISIQSIYLGSRSDDE